MVKGHGITIFHREEFTDIFLVEFGSYQVIIMVFKSFIVTASLKKFQESHVKIYVMIY